MRQPTLAIFDFDGTLVDTWDWFAEELIAAVAAIRRRTVTRTELESLRGLGSREVMKALGVNSLILPFIAYRIRRRAAAASGGFSPIPGIRGLLRELRRDGVHLALVSSNGRQAVANALGEQISALFTARRCGAAAFSKARAFDAILRETGRRASQAVVIGDETRDVEAAHKAGIEAIAVEWGFAAPELLRSVLPGRTARDPDELRDMLLRALSSDARREASG